MERRSGIVLAMIVLTILSLAGIGVSRLIGESGPGDSKQLTQEQRLNALESVTPQSPTVRAMVRAEKANEEARKAFDESGR